MWVFVVALVGCGDDVPDESGVTPVASASGSSSTVETSTDKTGDATVEATPVSSGPATMPTELQDEVNRQRREQGLPEIVHPSERETFDEPTMDVEPPMEDE